MMLEAVITTLCLLIFLFTVILLVIMQALILIEEFYLRKSFSKSRDEYIKRLESENFSLKNKLLNLEKCDNEKN